MPTGIYPRKPLSKYIVDTKTKCWNYSGKLKNNGYGEHKYYFEKLTGKKVPAGMTLDHLCKNKICVNPQHLDIVTMAENKRRSSKLNYSIIKKIKKFYSNGKTQCEIAKMIGINQCHVSRIINNLRWS